MLTQLERLLTFKPNKTDHGGLKAVAHHRLRFGSEFGLDLDGAWMPQNSAAAVLFIHGNRHNITRFEEHYRLFNSLGISCFAFDYPGYGSSKGAPSEAALYSSARAAHSYMCRSLGIQPRNIAIYGCSLGGAVAVELACSATAGCLITESTFTNSREIAKHLYPLLPIRHFLPTRFANDHRIARIAIPKLLIHGDKDERVPVHMAHTLFEKAAHPKRLQIITNADHINCVTVGGSNLHSSVRDFILEHCVAR
jgi:fermentation-respiration switch protein FrsA (DUF1100 family)